MSKLLLMKFILFGTLCFGVSLQASVHAQSTTFDEDQLGAWYMYFYGAKLGDKGWGIQGDLQVRNWNIAGDLEQLLVRSGLTYKPKNTSGTFTLGLANITTGAFGESSSTVSETRVYQEALLPHKLAKRVLLAHRFRYEQRFNQDQDFRTRYRYNFFVTVPFNADELTEGTWYAAFYNEIFINGQREIGDGREVQFFDRNRTYIALGYGLSPKLRAQFGIMKQTTNTWSKNQLQLSLHHSW